MNTTELAKLQDIVIYNILNNKPVNKKHIKLLKRNKWVKVAERLAPNNLVVRNLCILGLVDDCYWEYRDRIKKVVKRICPVELWTEGYSYWLYTKPILNKFGEKYYLSIKAGVEIVDRAFQKTAYVKDGWLWPAPFGDIRQEPLENCLQVPMDEDSLIKRSGESWMWREYRDGAIYYYISPKPVGLNTHCPNEYNLIRIGTDEFPYVRNKKGWTKFSFYKGYNSKYKNKFEMIKDTFLCFNRWRSL